MHPLRAFLATLCALMCITLLHHPTAHADFIDHFATNEDVGRAKVPAYGTSRILVIPLQVDGYDPVPIDALRAYFAEDTPIDQYSFTGYFERMSMGAFRPTAYVADPITYDSCPLPEDYFGYEDCAIPRGGGDTALDANASLQAGLDLIEEILRRADEEQGIDFSQFDTNGPDGAPDGWIDGILLIHNMDFPGIALPVYWVRENFRAQEADVIDDVKINIVGIADTANVALHEFGHLLGWADLYDESGASHGLQYSLMGSWNYVEEPQGLDPFSRIQIGWTSPSIYDTPGTYTDLRLRLAPDTGDAIQIGSGTEYFLVEHRGRTSGDYMDFGIPTRGLAVYHVNTRRAPQPNDGLFVLRLLNCANCDTWNPLLMNEQADGLFELQRPGSRRDDADDLFTPGDSLLPSLQNTDPLGPDNKVASSNFYDGSVSGISITNIRTDGDDLIFDLSIEEPCQILDCGDGTCEEGRCIPPENPTPEADAGMTDDTSDDDTDADTSAPPPPSDNDDGCSTSQHHTPSPLHTTPLLALFILLYTRRRNPNP